MKNSSQDIKADFEKYFQELAQGIHISTFNAVLNFEIFAWYIVNEYENLSLDGVKLYPFIPSHAIASLKELSYEHHVWYDKGELISQMEWTAVYEAFNKGPAQELRDAIMAFSHEYYYSRWPLEIEGKAWRFLKECPERIPSDLAIHFDQMRKYSEEIGGWVNINGYFPYVIWNKEYNLYKKKHPNL